MRRRMVICDTLLAAGLLIASGVIDSAARLDPVDTSPASRARKVANLEAAVHAHVLDFPTVPTVDQLPALLRDYVAAHHLTRQVGLRRTYSSMAYLAAFIGANLASWQNYAQAALWYRKALSHATRVSDRKATGWIAARSTQLGDTKRARATQDEVLAAYPTGAVTDRTFLALDHADCLRQDGYPRDAARHATQTLLSLTPECALPILLDRAGEIADAIGTAGRSDTDDLRDVLRNTRDITAI